MSKKRKKKTKCSRYVVKIDGDTSKLEEKLVKLMEKADMLNAKLDGASETLKQLSDN